MEIDSQLSQLLHSLSLDTQQRKALFVSTAPRVVYHSIPPPY